MADLFSSFRVSEAAPRSESVPEDEVPSWLLAADNHNIGNTSGGSWLSPSSWAEKLGNAGRFMAVSALSGTNSFYNTGVSVGNWFGANLEERDTQDWISEIDSNLGMYYAKERQAADLVGFVLGAVAPGLGGIKVLNAGQKALMAAQAGKVGTNISWSTKLLVPQTEKYMNLAKADIARNAATFSNMNGNALKMYASGAQQQVMEAAAFEIAAFAALHKAPIFDEMDAGDVMKNIATGALVGGAIGTVFTAARGFYALKKAGSAEDVATKAFTARDTPAEALDASTKIILSSHQRDSIAVPFLAAGGDAVQHQKDVRLFIDTQTKINNDIRTSAQKLTGTDVSGDLRRSQQQAKAKDIELGNLLGDLLHVNPDQLLARTTDGAVQPSHLNALENLSFAKQVTRLREDTGVEKMLREAVKTGVPPTDELFTNYVSLFGKTRGNTSDQAPAVLGLSDFVVPKAGQTTKEAVLDEVKKMGFTTSKLWNPLDELEKHPGTFARVMEGRKLWARDLKIDFKQDTVVHPWDIPVLEHAFQSGQWNKIKLANADGTGNNLIGSSQELYLHIKEIKENLAGALQVLHPKASTEAVAKALNVSLEWLEGTARSIDNEVDDLFWRESVNRQHTALMKDAGLMSENSLTRGGELPESSIRTEYLPNHMKVAYQVPKDVMEQINGNVLDGIAYFKGLEKEAITTAHRVFAAHASEFYQQAPTFSDDALLQTGRQGSGPGLVSFAAGGYGSPEAIVQQIGSVTNRLKMARKEAAKETLNAPLMAMAQDQKAAIEFSVLNQKLALTSEKYVPLSAEDAAIYGFEGKGMISRKLLKKLQGMADDVDEMDDLTVPLQKGAEEFIPIKNDVTWNVVQAHVKRNGERVNASIDIAAAYGRTNALDAMTYYPVKPNPKDYKHIAFVKDERVTGAGHTSMIHANSERELQELLSRVPPEYKTYTKVDVEQFKKARGEFELDRSLNENYIDSDMARKGIAGTFFPKTDPQAIVDEILQQHLRQEDVIATELMRLRYQKQFAFLEDQGSQYAKLEASKYGTTLDQVEKYEKNPYLSYVKTALDVTRTTDYPLLFGLNRALDEATSRVVSKIKGIGVPKTTEQIEAINRELKAAGYNNAYYDAALELYANHPAPKGELTKFVRGANAILARFTLGLDPLNALTNIVGANVLRGTELKHLTRAIEQANPELAGKLAGLTKVKLPGAEGVITSPSKLLSNSVTRFFKDMRTPGHPLATYYKQNGWIRNNTEQFRSMLDDFTLQGTEGVTDLNTKLAAAQAKASELLDKGEKLSGNIFAEEFNRFISADVMKQITDVAEQAGVLTKKEARAYINTFLTRVEGNYLASQRPLVFQGPIGQAVGLFQSYQFNLMQQLFRYAGEGKGKDIAMLMGLQGTFFGLNGLPAFQAINEHIVGTASGNPQHRDLYDAAYGIAGKTGGEFLLYGLPSSLLQANIYSRGDINPRQWTILPNSLAQVPAVGAYSKFFGSMYETAKNIGGGAGVWNAFLEGLEHNGISRPLAGLSQTLRATVSADGKPFSSSTRGTVMGTNDLFSWATAVRLAGGRPMDEAIVNDAVYRLKAYEGVDRERKQRLAEVVKLEVIGGQIPSEDQVARFAEKYLELGGKQSQFNKYMMDQYKRANTPQSQLIYNQLNNPMAQKLQVLMGGEDPGY